MTLSRLSQHFSNELSRVLLNLLRNSAKLSWMSFPERLKATSVYVSTYSASSQSTATRCSPPVLVSINGKSREAAVSRLQWQKRRPQLTSINRVYIYHLIYYIMYINVFHIYYVCGSPGRFDQSVNVTIFFFFFIQVCYRSPKKRTDTNFSNSVANFKISLAKSSWDSSRYQLGFWVNFYFDKILWFIEIYEL